MPPPTTFPRVRPTTRRRITAAVTAVTALTILGGACSTGDTSLTASRQSPERGTADMGSTGEVGADLQWARCTEEPASLARLECATLTVPLDPAEPDGATIDLALARHRSTGPPADRIGSIVFNPGGPGGSGIEFLANASAMIPEELTERFDLVSFDPRGVGESTPVWCQDDETRNEQLEGDLSPDDEEELEASLDEQEAFIAACERESGDMLRHMSTADVAADLDRIREAIGDDQLTYVGFSYGTSIGATYATLFPENTRALVLDGSVSPAASPEERTLAQGHGFEGTLASFIRHCDADTRCALGPDAAGAIAATRESLDQTPVEVDTASGPRTMGIDLFDYALATALYDTSIWGPVAEAIAEVRAGGARLLFTLVDRQLGRNPDGTFDNSNEAQAMVNCADQTERPTLEEGVASARRVTEQLPTFGPILGWGALACLDWPQPANPLPPVTGAGAPPILVVGTIGDPATPYTWSEQMADALESGHLLTYEGDGHTAFLRGGDCIDDAVVAYLLDLTLPPNGTRCPAQTEDVSFGGLRDEVVTQLVEAGLTESLAACIVDGLIGELGEAGFDQLILENDIETLTAMVSEHAPGCQARG